MNTIRSIIISFIKATRPLFGGFGVCRYAYSCTHYAEYQLKHESFGTALRNILKRVISCNPFW